MLKQGTFVYKKYRRLLLVNLLGWGGYCLNLMMDSIVGGNQLGEVALQAVSIVYPMISFLNFFTFVVAPGVGTLFGKYKGKFDDQRAYDVAGQGMLVSAFIGVVVAVLLVIIKEPFLTYYGCTGELYEAASAYYNYMPPLAIINSIQLVFYYLVIADGELVLGLVCSFVGIPLNVIGSIILANSMGTAGLGLSTCISLFVCGALQACHLFKKSNGVHFSLHFRWEDVWQSMMISASRCLAYIFIAVVDIVMNKIIIERCGMEYIPAYSIVNLAFSFFEMYGAIFDAGIGFVASFEGERNYQGVHALMKNVTNSIVMMGLCIFALFFFGARWMVALYGLTSEMAVTTSLEASRIMAFGAIPFGVCYLAGEFFSTLGKIKFSWYMTVLNDLVTPLLLAIPLCYAFGFLGVEIGMALSAYAAVAVYTVTVKLKCGKEGFPFYFQEGEEEQVTFDLYLTPESIVEVRDSVVKEMEQRGFSNASTVLLLEELLTRILDKNKKRVCVQCCLFFSETKMRMIIRDDGEIMNLLEENSVETMNSYVLDCLLSRVKNKSYVLTTSYNRNGFVIEKS